MAVFASGVVLMLVGPAPGTGTAGRWMALTGAIVGDMVLAIALIPHFSLWTTPGAFPRHHH